MVLGYVKRMLGKVWRGGKTKTSSKRNKSSFSDYDHQTVEVMERTLQADSCAVDIGAHRGAILREIIRIAPRGVHYAFEPIPSMAENLRREFPQVRVHEVALSDHDGSEQFQLVENAPAYSGLRRRLYDRPDPVITTISVKVARLDDVIDAEHPVKLIKLDIEGGEYHALQGAVRTILRCRPVVVFEASARSTGQYGVSPEEMFRLVTQDLECHLSTMERWLHERPPYSLSDFCDNWNHGPEYYFIAYPIGK